MFKIMLILGVLLLSNVSAKYVRGYTKSNGTHVSGYHRTKANYSKHDNYSSYGNTNPYTGKKGYGK